MLVLLVAFVLGEWPARMTRLEVLFAKGTQIAATLKRKLDRSKRGVATVVWRGIIAVIVLIVPVLAIGIALSQPAPWLPYVTGLVLIAWFGQAFATYGGWSLWHRARADKTPLELPRLKYLFADSHAVLRYSIETQADRFATGVVGASCWYVLGGMPLMLVYLALASAAAQFTSPAFGWAARNVFAAVDAIPRLMSRLLFSLAGCLTPHAHPLKALVAGNWRLFVANLVGGTLGGPMPGGEQPWVGGGTARLTPQHLRTMLVIQLVASILLLLLVASPVAAKLLINII